jgi:hydroxymethylglutaryl-CoA lyase
MEGQWRAESLAELLKRPPGGVVLREVGLRDGLQNLGIIVPTETKAELALELVRAGYRHVQAAAFVHPGRVPQMADAEALFARLGEVSGTRWSGLCLNPRGVERAVAAGADDVEISLSASRTHSLKNAGMDTETALGKMEKMTALAREGGTGVWASVQCAFGCAYEGEVPEERVAEIAERLLKMGIDVLMLADTAGVAGPGRVLSVLGKVLPLAGGRPVGLHLHDTLGRGLVNLLAGLGAGATVFDTAFGGLGGCPFVPGAAGNVAGEDAALLLEGMGVGTGVDAAVTARCARRLEALLGARLDGRAYRVLG